MKEVILLRGAEFGKGFILLLAAVGVNGGDAAPPGIARHQAGLVAQLGLGAGEGSLHIPQVAMAVGQLHLFINKHRHTLADAAGAVFILRDQPSDGGKHELPLLLIKKGRDVIGADAFTLCLCGLCYKRV